MNEVAIQPGYVFEVSWEVCNKVGGIHTVISTKALTMVNEWEDHVIMIGPDIWKGMGEPPEFAEDKNLLAAWRNYAESTGLKIKVGRWKITGNPIAVLVDFTPFFHRKDSIFADLWMRYTVDSLTGQWDYIEPALFGYAAGKVIETFYHFHLTLSDKIIAQFHEWMTGAGILYLEEHVPQIGTVFTTHATVVGRALAGNGLPFYSKFDSFNADNEARNYNIVAKYSLEKTSAAYADCFTTVSEITARECERFLGKKPDVITPNGFEDFIVPDPFFFLEKRSSARKKLLQVVRALTGQNATDDALLIIKSGRYEFRNKGIDVFIDALGMLNKNVNLKKQVVAFIFIPANNTGPRRDLLQRMDSFGDLETKNDVLTHNLQGAEADPIMKCIEKNQLINLKKNKVKVVFAPVYLDGNDGIFDLPYYDLLTGFDLSAFPSYYEPWGYTPLESLAFQVPTITTNLTGFGMVIHPGAINIDHGIEVIKRDDNNHVEAAQKIADVIADYSGKSAEQIKAARTAAGQLSRSASWKNLINNYKTAYSLALEKAAKRTQKFQHISKVESLTITSPAEGVESSEPTWQKLFVQSQLPESLHSLSILSRNLWWTWNRQAVELFEMIDYELWWRCGHNPINLLNDLSLTQINKLEKNEAFMKKLGEVYERFKKYMNRPVTDKILKAYFCMEYGLDRNLRTYSGGLGILAGDYLKEASDQCNNVIGVGLLYRQGYFSQVISSHGEQVDIKDAHRFTCLPLIPVYDQNGNWLMVGLAFPGRTLYAKVWKVAVGLVSLFLLDTDITENRDEDRSITAQLYGGDNENRLKQELLLGIGGVRMLRLLGHTPDIFHYNDGHPAFAGIELIRLWVQEENLSFDEALEIVKSQSLFTSHTAVSAGYDYFSEEMLRTYLSQLAKNLNVSWKRLMGLGRVNEDDSTERFSISILAAKLSCEINAVSSLHEKATRKIFRPLWQAYAEEELSNVGHVTNGVHLPTWISPQWQALYEQSFNGDFIEKYTESGIWEKIKDIPDASVWQLHCQLKKELLHEIITRVKDDNSLSYQARERILLRLNGLNESALIFGFARRMVGYKRALLLFNKPEKLLSVIRNAGCPVMFLFAGKAHPQDKEGKDIIKRIIEISEQPEFEGNIIFLHNYDIVLAKHLSRSVDVWLNTPTLYMEASGTSGMKAMLNGVLNLSMLDGWWAEAYRKDAGWAFGEREVPVTPDLQNELDAESLYRAIEERIIPEYLERNSENIPVKWIAKIKTAIVQMAPQYSMKRALEEYEDKYYKNLQSGVDNMRRNNFEAARRMSKWKCMIIAEWNNVKVISSTVYDSANKAFPLGSELSPRLILDPGSLNPAEIGVEIVFVEHRKPGEQFGKIVYKKELIPSEIAEGKTIYDGKVPMAQPGVYEYAFRIFPKNTLLLHRQDIPLCKWA